MLLAVHGKTRRARGGRRGCWESGAQAGAAAAP